MGRRELRAHRFSPQLLYFPYSEILVFICWYQWVWFFFFLSLISSQSGCLSLGYWIIVAVPLEEFIVAGKIVQLTILRKLTCSGILAGTLAL